MKYIVKNCPCYVEGIAIKGNEQKTQTCNNHKIRELTYCADCTDCIIKQVIEKCEESIKYFKYGVPEHSTDTAMTYTEKRNKADFAMQILDMFDIEEVNK